MRLLRRLRYGEQLQQQQQRNSTSEASASSSSSSSSSASSAAETREAVVDSLQDGREDDEKQRNRHHFFPVFPSGNCFFLHSRSLSFSFGHGIFFLSVHFSLFFILLSTLVIRFCLTFVLFFLFHHFFFFWPKHRMIFSCLFFPFEFFSFTAKRSTSLHCFSCLFPSRTCLRNDDLLFFFSLRFLSL